MKAVKEIYAYFHQFPNADKKSASLMDFLETISGFSEPDSRGNGLATMNMSGSAGQKRIQTPFFEKLRIYLPPIELQNQFADFVRATDKLKLATSPQTTLAA